MLSLAAAHPVPAYSPTGAPFSAPDSASAAAVPAALSLLSPPGETGLWAALASFRQNLDDPRVFTIVLFGIAAMNLLTVVLALVLWRVSRRAPEALPLPMPPHGVRHLRAVSADLDKSV